MALLCLLVVTLLFANFSAVGQDFVVTVPDLRGLNVPTAAATLKRAGLQLGYEQIIAVDSGSGDTENTISGQSPAAGESVAPQTSIDITVIRAANAYLIYDDNDLTLVNVQGGLLDLAEIQFSAEGPNGALEFNPTAWAANLDEGRCGQIWSVGRVSSKAIEGCSIVLWMTATNSSQHFWTYTAGVETFSVIQNGEVRALCPAAPAGSQDAPLRCDVVFDIDYAQEHISYIYLAYTTDRLIIHNQTEDRWMELSDTLLRDSASRDIDLSALDFFSIEDHPVRLAPDDCIFFALETGAQPPEPCHVIGQVQTDTAFWLEPFRVIGRDNYPRVCEAAEADTLMICVMLR